MYMPDTSDPNDHSNLASINQDNDFKQIGLESKASFDEYFSQHIIETANNISMVSSIHSQNVHKIPHAFRMAPKASLYDQSDEQQPISNNLLKELENYVQIRIQKDIEKIDDMTDKYPLLEYRKACLRISKGFSELCSLIITNSVFDAAVILVIILNTIILALEDPLANQLPYPFPEFELFFAIFYTIECLLKIFSLGFIFPTDSYLRDWWNVLDFLIVITAWLDLQAGSGVKLSALRSLRILRPLRSISSISGMRTLFMALINSIKPLISALVVLFFFTIVFAIGAVQLWSGVLKYRCYDVQSGSYGGIDDLCGAESCSGSLVCASSLDNPNKGSTNFDNILISFFIVFQIITMEGWTSVMLYTIQGFSKYSVFYYIPLLFIAANLILNLTLAIITSSFKEMSEKLSQKPKNDFVSVDDDIFQRIYNNSTVEKPVTARINKKIRTFDSEVNEEQLSKRIKFDKKIHGIEKVKRRPVEEYQLEDESVEFFGGVYENKGTARSDESPKLGVRVKAGFEKEEIGNEKEDFNRFERFLGNDTLKRNSNPFMRRASFYVHDNEEVKFRKRNSVIVLHEAITVRQATLKILKRDPSSIKKSRIELLETYKSTSESMLDIIPPKKSTTSSTSYSFAYTSQDATEFLLLSHLKSVVKLKKKHPKYLSDFSLFNHLSKSKKLEKGFFKLRICVKSYILEQQKYAFHINAHWSGYDTSMKTSADHAKFCETISNMNYRLWPKGLTGFYLKLRYPIRCLVLHRHVNSIIILSVLANTFLLAYDHYGISNSSSNDLQQANDFFTFFFAAELILKIFALGIITYLRDFMNYFDIAVVTLSLIEVFLITDSALSALKAIRIIRVFRVLKVIRLFRYMKSLENLVRLIGSSISNLSYLFLLLMLFQVIFTLLGMQIFGGTFSFPDGLPRGNFDSFHWAFVTTFQVLTTENWNDILTSSIRSSVGLFGSLFLIIWIILGNFILLNLFLAILLDSVSSYGADSEDDELDISNLKMNTNFRKRLNSVEKFKDSDSEISLNIAENVKDDEDPFKDVGCQRSFFIFSQSNRLRIWAMKKCKKQTVDSIILVVIISNSLKLAWDTYIIEYPSDSVESQISSILDNVFTSIFTLEFLVKSLAFGFIKDQNSYLSDNWNRLDFLIVILSLIDLSVSGVNLPAIRVFRLLRTLRPLRLINHNIPMKIAVSALIESFIGIFNVLAVIVIIWLVFAILGVSLLSGKMYYCSNSLLINQIDCENSGFSWINTNSNFDNVLYAMVTLFIVMSQESWPNRMYEGVDAFAIGSAPVMNYNPGMAYYYILYLVIGNFFLVNLFTVIVFTKFNEAKKNENTFAALFLSKKQLLWSEIQKFVIAVKPESTANAAQMNRLRAWMFLIGRSRKLEIFIMAVIIVNMLIMAMPYEGASSEYLQVLENLNTVCTYIFFVEAAVKLCGFGCVYFKNAWNCFDFFVVSASLVDIVISSSGSSSNPLLRQGPQLIRIIRVLRISRLFRLIKSLESLQKLIMIITYAMPAILNVFSLLLLVYFIYAILGVFLFHTVTTGNAISIYYNFSNFSSAMNILWRISTGEDYPTIMYDCAAYLGSKVYFIYFISFVIVIDFVLLNLFVSIILENYEEFSNNPENALSLFSRDLKVFKRHWILHTTYREYYRIHKDNLVQFMGEIIEELKLVKNNSGTNVIYFIGSMNLVIDCDGCAYFNDVLYGIMKKKYNVNKKRNGNKHMLKLIRKEESSIKKKLKEIREKYMKDKAISKKDHEMFVKALFIRSLLRKWSTYTKRVKKDISITSRYSSENNPGENSIIVSAVCDQD